MLTPAVPPGGRGHQPWEKVEPSAPAGSNPDAMAWRCLAPQEARTEMFLAQSQVANPNFTLSSGPQEVSPGLSRSLRTTCLCIVGSKERRN